MHTTEKLDTILFDRNGNTTVASTVSQYVAVVKRSSSRLGAAVRNEMHLVLHNRQWIVVSRSGSQESPVYIQDRTVPDAGTGKSFIHQTLSTYEQDPA
ncbi:hypothetical protein [Leucobacter aridicollis]|uniref:Uncharacterized protein n=1 Tax=Leucobacter aridicollis TaxID=283878 RepID=A0A852RG75_9MICO|nr:hypothetical protein [Leucobacter aridicollis]MBL3681121.1 hypothetical protein [Leucobacter aridicollis]NYD27870.1 hypothetical protein [Leucobacter aridicollis]